MVESQPNLVPITTKEAGKNPLNHASLIAKAIATTRTHDTWSGQSHPVRINGKEIRVDTKQTGEHISYGILGQENSQPAKTREEIQNMLGEDARLASGAILYEMSRQHRQLSADLIKQAAALDVVSTTRIHDTNKPDEPAKLNVYLPDKASHKMILLSEPIPEEGITPHAITEAKTLIANPIVQRKLADVQSQAVEIKRNGNNLEIHDLQTNNVYEVFLNADEQPGTHLQQLMDRTNSTSTAESQQAQNQIGSQTFIISPTDGEISSESTLHESHSDAGITSSDDFFESDANLLTNEQKEWRIKLERQLKTIGRIIERGDPDGGEFAQMVHTVSRKLGVPSDVAVYAVDTEYPTAFYAPQGKAIAITRGMMRLMGERMKKDPYFQDKGIQLSEDHLAAVLAHEIEHAIVLDETYVEKVLESFENRILSNLSYAEEFRADAEASRKRLADGGYNAHAVVDMLQSFGLTADRHDNAHPEAIDRIEKLELEFSNDEKPIRNAHTPLQPFSETLNSWVYAESNVYNQTEQLLHATPEQLKDMLLQTTSQEEFWRIFHVWKQAETLVAGNEIVKRNDATMKEYVKNIAILNQLETLTGKEPPRIFGKPQKKTHDYFDSDGQIRTENQVKFDQNSPFEVYKHEVNSYWTSLSLEQRGASALFDEINTGEVKNVIIARKYREQLLSIAQTPEQSSPLNAAAIQLRELSDRTSVLVESIFTDLQSKMNSFSPTQQAYISALENLFRDQDTQAFLQSESLFQTAFKNFDDEYQQYANQQEREDAAKKGLRVDLPESSLSFDLKDPLQRERILFDVSLEAATRLAKIEIPDEITRHFSALLSHNLPKDAAQIAGPVLINQVTGKPKEEAFIPWVEYITHIPRRKLAPLIMQSKELTLPQQNVQLSSFRPLHQAFRASSLLVDDRNFGNTTIRDDIDNLALLPIVELERRATKNAQSLKAQLSETYDFPELDFSRLWVHNPSGVDFEYLHFSLDEMWAMNSHGEKGINGVIWAINTYCHDVKLGKKIDPRLEKMITAEYATHSLISPKQMNTLLDKPPTHAPNTVWEIIDNFNFAKSWQFHINKSKKADTNIRQMYSAAKKLYQLYEQLPEKKKRGSQHLSGEFLSATMLAALQRIKEKNGRIPHTDAAAKAIIEISNQGVDIDFNSLYDTSLEAICHSSIQQLEVLQTHFKNKSSRSPHEQHFLEMITVLQEIPIEQRKAITDGIPDDGYNSNSPYHEAVKNMRLEHAFLEIATTHREGAINWLLKRFPDASPYRDMLVVGVIDFSDPQTKEKLLASISPDMFSSTLDADGYKKSQYPFEVHHAITNRYFSLEKKLPGQGFQEANYPDLMRRRYPFSTLSFSTPDTINAYNNVRTIHINGIDPVELALDARKGNFASSVQRLQALRLFSIEANLFDTQTDVFYRLLQLTTVISTPTVVRDMYLEEMLHREFTDSQTSHAKKIALAKVVFPLFTENTDLIIPFAQDVMKARIAVDPNILNDFDSYQETLLQYLPKPSFARNYFLDVWENAQNTLTPEQLAHIQSLRISAEGKTNEDDDAPMTFIFNKLSEVDRAEKVKALTWMLGISQEKSILIREVEGEFDGNLDSFPKVFGSITSNEREVLLARLLLGAEGILDLQAVGEDQLPQAEAQRDEFLKSLGEKLFANSPNPTLFQGLFTTMITASDPAHGTQVLTKLINRLYETQTEKKELSSEEAVTIALTEMGVVGKKIAQYLGELSWMGQYPEFQKALRKAQEEGPVVPRRAVMEFAKYDGLLDGSQPFKIIAFGPSLGSASNKQANRVTVEVLRENNLGLEVGTTIDLVYKVMRPSAQKGNLGHDLKVAKAVYEKAIELLPPGSLSEKIPVDFLTEIEDTVTRELDFLSEEQFNHTMRPIIEARSHRNGTSITMPQIGFASKESMLETFGEGKSLRALYDLQEASRTEQKHQAIRQIEQSILVESLMEIIDGTFHVDLHPGNIFVDYDETSGTVNKITFIDWGMREEAEGTNQESPQLKTGRINLLMSLALGDEASLQQSLEQLGWEKAQEVTFELNNSENYAQNFAQNALELLNKTASISGMPRVVRSAILALSKVERYARNVDPSTVVSSLIGALMGTSQ